MQLSFATDALFEAFLEPRDGVWPSDEMQRDAESIVADLAAASNLLEVPVGVPDLRDESAAGFDIAAGSIVLECRVNHVSVRRGLNGRPDWSSIHRLKIDAWRPTREAVGCE